MQDCDAILMAANSFPYIEFMPNPGQPRGIQIDLGPARIGLRYPVEMGLVGDGKRTPRESASRNGVSSNKLKRHEGPEGTDGQAGNGDRSADETSCGSAELGKRLPANANRELRFGNHCHVVGAPRPG